MSDAPESPARGLRPLPALALFAGALALRLLLIVTTRDDPVFATPMLDAEYAVDWARSLGANGFWSSPEGTAYFRTPLYTWFLAGAFALPGPDLATARVLQAILGAAAAVLLADVAARRAGRAAGWITGALAALAWPLLLFGRELLIASLVVFLGAAILRTWAGATERSGSGRWLATGLLIGLGGLARPNLLAFLPAALVLAPLAAGGGPRWRRAALVLLGAVVVIAPITIRNQLVSGDPVLLSSQGGINLWIGNHPEADGMSAVLPGFSSWRNEDVEAELDRTLGPEAGPARREAHFRGLAFDAVRRDPLGALSLTAKKTWLFVQGYEIRNNRDLYDLRSRSGLLSLPLPDFGILLPLALLGIAVAGRRRRDLAPEIAWAGTAALAVILFFVCARYRLAAWPGLLVLAGVGGAGLLDSGISRRARALRLVALVALVLAARIDPIGVRNPDESQPRFQAGNVHARLGNWEEAEQEYRRAIELAPGFAEARHHLGALYLRQDRAAEALPELRRAVAGMPRSFRARRSLAEALEAAGRFAEALEVRRDAVTLSAGAPADRLALADALGRVGSYAGAWELYAELGREGADDAWFSLNAGQTALAVKREEAGIRLLERATKHEETRGEAWLALARWHLSQRQPDLALPVLSEAILHVSADPRLHRLRAVARYATGDATGALEDLDRVLELDPDDDDSRRKRDELAGTSGAGG